jgi:hypothetical protein
MHYLYSQELFMQTTSITYKILDYCGVKGQEKLVTVTQREDIERVEKFIPELVGIQIIKKQYKDSDD